MLLSSSAEIGEAKNNSKKQCQAHRKIQSAVLDDISPDAHKRDDEDTQKDEELKGFVRAGKEKWQNHESCEENNASENGHDCAVVNGEEEKDE